ncbi:Phosphoribosylaminoimidazolecarboxamide formyltransferase [Dissulfuribacter thermophilus]|uniref:Phosphoribosylaminoimidazolecarboxamide formyltransferase n=1 Tax=Dissulfuribacter thermophilus TaxID=1156395 RepID=A0A1B9F652_9BACT|nr:IMP cyclohydrolase [Dissulfuribacter thermophilus]OCC15428.1 Phosphoribosylaminoimidazolecarboxamide formyltransferase [Dissulfuribacter thermophilus]
MADMKEMYKKIIGDQFPDEMKITLGDQTLVYRKRTWVIDGEERGLRYGENPDQQAALYELVNGNLVLGDCHYIEPGNGLVSAISEEDMIQAGKHPGKINLTDVDNSLNVLKFLMDNSACVIVKHNNPCGVALGDSLEDAFTKAFRADRVAAFGGCVALNRPVDKATAEAINSQYFEVVAAPDYEEGTVDILKQRKNLRIIKIARIDRLEEYWDKRFIDFKCLIDGGIIIQQSPVNKIRSKEDLKPAECEYQGKVYKIKRLPDEREYKDIIFGWAVEQGITSNSVIYVKNGVTVGIGTGEQDRVGVAEIAVYKAYTKYADIVCFDRHGISYKELELKVEKGEMDKALKDEIDQKVKEDRGGLPGSVMVSDAFFPFRDGVDVGIRQGITAIVHPGGSLRDWESIEACNEADPPVAMVFTGQRAFKH